ncbi:protein-disulfide reductase DsbD [Novosphingobium sp. Gsoil 351]|uniref:protein-disulfide reductase DsbD family protein n=1 Tax=Novosphingobium sp. Gsoil 351 TaxID=2675225 RepID=UPI001E2C247C|nr:thioredoxin family protein [Novosphingobium sp. Gsoil 351]
MRVLATLVLAIAVLCGLVTVTAAQPALAQIAPTHMATELIAERAVAAPGQTIQLAVSMKPDKGWHGYWLNGGDAGFAMQFKWALPAGAKVAEPRYPVPQTLLINGLMNHVYEHDYALLVAFTLPASAHEGDTLAISAEADWLVCTEEICVPEHGRLATTVRVGPPAPRDARFDGWLAKLPAPLPETVHFATQAKTLRLAIPIPAALDLGAPHLFVRTDGVTAYAAPQRFWRKGDLLLAELGRPAGAPGDGPGRIDAVLRYGSGEGLQIKATPGAVASGGTPLVGTALAFDLAAFLGVLGGALLGGLILNIMPCVFPILSLKALSLAQANAAPGKARADGLAYTAGVILACLALGGTMLALRAAGNEIGWAFQLQEPLVIAALLALAVAITANFAGLFELPSLGGNGGSAGRIGERGAFGTGLLAAFVATPCTGPFMAAAMGAALILPPLLALTVFAALGLGLALPFLALGFSPALRRLLPRPGPWMERFRKAMALPMALTALALLWLAWRLGGAGFAIACGAIAMGLVAVLAMIGRAQHGGVSATSRAAPALAGLALVGAVLLPQVAGAPPAAAAADLLGAKPFSLAALTAARASGRPVFVYFTADWCLTCKVNEAAAIDRESTRDAFAKANVQVLRGDWTTRDPVITRVLETHGAAGVPLYLWYTPGSAEATILPQVLTPALLEATARKG